MKFQFPMGSLLMAGMVTPAFACGSSPSTSSPPPAGPDDVIVAATDYNSSQVGMISPDGASHFASGVDLGADPTLASSAGRYFWIARDLGEIIEIDPVSLSARTKYSANDPGTGGSTDPYDIAVAPDGSLWIARFDVSTVLVLNANGTRRRTVDLSLEDRADGNPHMNSIRILNPAAGTPASPGATGTMTTSKAYVSLDMLDGDLRSTRKSKLARIDLETGAVEDVLTLAGRNPLSLMVQLGNQLYLADAGTWCTAGECSSGQPDAGIERVDTASFTSKLLVTGDELGGHATELAVTTNCGAVIVAGDLPDTPTSLVQFDPRSGDLGTVASSTVIPTGTSFTLAGLAWVGGDVLYVGDRGEAGGSAGVRIFDADISVGCALRERPKKLALPLPAIGFAALR